MMINVGRPLLILLVALSVTCSPKELDASGDEPAKTTMLVKDKYDVVIIMDTIDDWSAGIRDGFKETLIKSLAGSQKKVNYTVIDTELNETKIPGIIEKIKSDKPDLICTINYPTAFADIMISQKLKDSEYKFVSENCIPIKSGTIKSWKKPGGNITGVGVFIQMNSPLRLMKKINPRFKKLAVYSWDRVPMLNEWLESEFRRACHEENIELLEFRRVPHQEATIEFFEYYNGQRDDIVLSGGVTAFVHKDGSAASGREEVDWATKHLKVPFVVYEETPVRYGTLAGTCVIWYDIGAQLAEKGLRVLKGENPGDIPWDYPRKYNIILNKKRAEDIGITIPQEIINASYRIYTDYNGNFIGQSK
jgi:putative ABC transport system substrate-binding protein